MPTQSKAEIEARIAAQGSWEDMRAHGTKRLLPYFSGTQMGRISVAVVRDWRATMLESAEARTARASRSRAIQSSVLWRNGLQRRKVSNRGQAPGSDELEAFGSGV